MNSKRATILKNKYVTYTQSDTNIKFRIVVRSVIFFCTWLFISVASSNDLSGVWKHSERTIWIEITTEKGTSIIVRNDRFPERVGRTFMTDIKALIPGAVIPSSFVTNIRGFLDIFKFY